MFAPYIQITYKMNINEQIIKELKKFDFSSISDEIYDDNTTTIELKTAHITFNLSVENRITFEQTRTQPEENEITHISASRLEVETDTADFIDISDIEQLLNKELNKNFLNV